MSLRSWILLLILSIMWGASFIFIEIALTEFSPFMVLFLPIFLAACLLLITVQIRHDPIPSCLNLWKTLGIMGFLENVAPFGLIVWAQTHITASTASILTATTPIFTVLLAHILTKDERLSLGKILGVFIGFIGVYIMIRPMMDTGLSWEGYSQLAVIGAAALYAMAGVWGKKLTKTSSLTNATGMLVCSSLMMSPFLFIFGNPFPIEPSWEGVGAIIALCVSSTAFAYMLYFKILANAGATSLSLVTFFVPISAISLGVIILDEPIPPTAIYGMITIFTGVAFIDHRLTAYVPLIGKYLTRSKMSLRID